jgi:hypothetical protein
MILYSVTVSIDEDVHEEWLQWMQEIHIPEVMRTGKFIESRICKIHAEEVGGKSYSFQYLAKSWDDYNSYQQEHAPSLQKDHTARYGGKFVAFRTVLEVIQQTRL